MDHQQKDKFIEQKRYSTSAKKRLESSLYSNEQIKFGVDSVPIPISSPYIEYESIIDELITPESVVLELGSGMGRHSKKLMSTNAFIVTSDISMEALICLDGMLGEYANFSNVVADIEQLPFDDGMFDYVCSAGVLSYGSNEIVMKEIWRILKKNGKFICVDSLNNSPIYRLNRYVHYVFGRRTSSTLYNMPTVTMLTKYSEKFDKVDIRYFGSISWLIPVIQAVAGEELTKKISDFVDWIVKVKRSAFKFVLIAEK